MKEQLKSENVDPSEVKKFSNLASKWWEKKNVLRPLHEINPLRLEFIDQRTPVFGKKVLDVGCGGGILSESLAKKGAYVTGIDIGEELISAAHLHAIETGINVDYQQITVEHLAESKPEHWDIINCLEMLEHVPYPSSIVHACSNLLKPGGSVYFSTINRNCKSFMMAIVGAEYVLKLLPKGTHQYEKFIKPNELIGWCEQSGLLIREMTGIHYNPLFRTYRLGNGVDVNYLIHSKKLR